MSTVDSIYVLHGIISHLVNNSNVLLLTLLRPLIWW